MTHRILALLAGVLLAFGLAACSSSAKKGSPSSSGAAAITIHNLTFTTTPVKAGSTVTVKNEDSIEHTVTSDTAGEFNVTVRGGSTATFTAPSSTGPHPFHCNIHSTMHGTLTVTA